jgi:hypothetical protein
MEFILTMESPKILANKMFYQFYQQFFLDGWKMAWPNPILSRFTKNMKTFENCAENLDRFCLF